MRIAYILTTLGVGGAERQVLALADRMAARGHAVLVVVLRRRGGHEWPTEREVHSLDMRKSPASILAGIARARRVLRAFRPDLVHSHTFPANMTARALRLLGCAAPVLSTIHNVYEGGRHRMLAYRLTDRLSRHTTAVSEAAALRYVHLKAVPPGKCRVLTNGVDTGEFAPDAERRSRVRAAMGVGGEFVWLAAGRVVPAKDYPNVLRAFARVREGCPDARLWIAGEAADAELGPLKTLAGELGLGESVRWLGLRRDMAGLLDAADGFVLGSAWEGMPLAVAEAMAMEKPVVATDVGGVRELVGSAGKVVPAGNAAALAEAMLEAAGQTPDERSQAGRAARRRIEDHFSMDVKADEWESLYLTLLPQER